MACCVLSHACLRGPADLSHTGAHMRCLCDAGALSATVAAAAVVLGWQLGLDYSAKLFVRPS